jgi:hypothetical protein
MSLQYISDSAGHHTAVIIPIEEWNEITAKHEDLKVLMPTKKRQNNKKERKLADFAGILSKEAGLAMIKDIEKSREEWERDF